MLSVQEIDRGLSADGCGFIGDGWDGFAYANLLLLRSTTARNSEVFFNFHQSPFFHVDSEELAQRQAISKMQERKDP